MVGTGKLDWVRKVGLGLESWVGTGKLSWDRKVELGQES